MKNIRLLIILLTSLILLLIPLIAMQFTAEVNWTLGDFVIAGALLFGAGIMLELAIRKVKRKKYRIAIIVSFLLALFLVWAEIAVGIFGTSDDSTSMQPTEIIDCGFELRQITRNYDTDGYYLLVINWHTLNRVLSLF